MFLQTICRGKRRDWGRDCGNSCTLRAGVSMLTPFSSWPGWAISALLFDYRSKLSTVLLSRVKGDYRKRGRLSSIADPSREKANVVGVIARVCASEIPQSRARLCFEHKRDADAGTIQSPRGVGLFSGRHRPPTRAPRRSCCKCWPASIVAFICPHRGHRILPRSQIDDRGP